MDIEFLRREQVAETIWVYTFNKPSGFDFRAGDYVELAVEYPADPIGGRRWLTISSSPHEEDLQFITKLPAKAPSDYKQALHNYAPGQSATISPAIGTFHLPRNKDDKLLWVAGGVGITPFLSQMKWLEQSKQQRDISLLYVAKPNEHLFVEELKKVATIKQPAQLNSFADLAKHCPDVLSRSIFLSGPQPFCENLFYDLIKNNAPRNRLNLDYFEGYDEL